MTHQYSDKPHTFECCICFKFCTPSPPPFPVQKQGLGHHCFSNIIVLSMVWSWRCWHHRYTQYTVYVPKDRARACFSKTLYHQFPLPSRNRLNQLFTAVAWLFIHFILASILSKLCRTARSPDPCFTLSKNSLTWNQKNNYNNNSF